MPFADGKPTPQEVEDKKLLDDYLAREAARPLTKKIADEADQIAMRDPWWVWALAGFGAIALLVMVAIILFSCRS